MDSPVEIERILIERYELEAKSVTGLAGGADADSLVYRVDTADRRAHVLKLRTKRSFRTASLLVPAYLRELGIEEALGPVRTAGGELFVDLPGSVLVLYPWLDARTVAEAGLDLQSWNELGRTVRSIHEATLASEVRESLGTESFVPSRREFLGDSGEQPLLLANGQKPVELEELFVAKRDVIRALLDYVDAVGEELRERRAPHVLCHADLHGWNLLVDGKGKWWIIDWDEVVLAPKERDLMFVMKGIGRGLVKPKETEAFLAGYGDPLVDEELLSYYRCAWAVQDIAAYAEEALSANVAASRASALQALRSLFAPGNIVDIAMKGVAGPADRMQR
ncbi:MAG TPA: phosphotransferase [Trueperaceae bacterium]